MHARNTVPELFIGIAWRYKYRVCYAEKISILLYLKAHSQSQRIGSVSSPSTPVKFAQHVSLCADKGG